MTTKERISPQIARQKSRHRRHSRNARLILFFTWILLRVGDVELARFCFWNGNPMPIARGVLIGGALIGTLLVFGIWLRHMWARYVLIVFNFAMIAFLSMPGLIIMNAREGDQRSALIHLGKGLALYVVANVVLIVSRRVSRLTKPQPSGQ